MNKTANELRSKAMTNSMNSLDMAHSTEYYLVCVPAIVREQCGSPQIPRLLARG